MTEVGDECKCWRMHPATEADIHALAESLPHTAVLLTPSGRQVYQVGGKSFVYFRNARKDAADPVNGERYDDVVVFWVEGEHAKQALVQDPASPFFTTDHFAGHPSVLLRLARVGELSLPELAEVIEDAWLSQASARRGRLYLTGTARITD